MIGYVYFINLFPTNYIRLGIRLLFCLSEIKMIWFESQDIISQTKITHYGVRQTLCILCRSKITKLLSLFIFAKWIYSITTRLRTTTVHGRL